MRKSSEHTIPAAKTAGNVRDYDEITAFLGTWGRFQTMIFLALSISILPNGYVGVYIVFASAIPPHECYIPEESGISEVWRNVSIPIETVNEVPQRSSCSRLSLKTVRSYSELNFIPNVDVNVSEIQLESCLDGWKYSKEIYQSTIVSDWDLVCDNKYKEPLTTTIYFIGVLVGTFISGQLSDRFGRRPVLFITMLLQTLAIFAQIFSPNWETFAAIFFFVGFTGFSNYVVAYVLGTEILSPETRVIFCSLGVFMSSGIGQLFLPLAAYYLRDWQGLVASMAGSGLLYIPLWWFVPESPRWLLSQGRVKEAEAILRKAAKQNGIEAPDILFTSAEIENALENKDKKHSIFNLLGSCNVFSVTLICSLLWMVITMAYFGLLLNTTNLNGDPYLNFLYSALVELPAYVIAMLLLKYCPRRFCQASTLFLGGVVILFIQLVPAELQGVAIFLEMVGKFGITSAFCVVYAVTSELFPTVVRTVAMGTCSMAARIGSMVSPFILYLGNYYRFLPYILIGGLAVFSSMLCYVLPESFRKVLPETIPDMQKLRGLKRKKKDTFDDNNIKEERF